MDMRVLVELTPVCMQGDKNLISILSFSANFIRVRAAQANNRFNNAQLLLNDGQSLSLMVKVMCCHSLFGKMCCWSVIHCFVAFMPQALEPLILQL
jgi:hypothetical protein